MLPGQRMLRDRRYRLVNVMPGIYKRKSHPGQPLRKEQGIGYRKKADSGQPTVDSKGRKKKIVEYVSIRANGIDS
jgi:hypothetical protein